AYKINLRWGGRDFARSRFGNCHVRKVGGLSVVPDRLLSPGLTLSRSRSARFCVFNPESFCARFSNNCLSTIPTAHVGRSASVPRSPTATARFDRVLHQASVQCNLLSLADAKRNLSSIDLTGFCKFGSSPFHSSFRGCPSSFSCSRGGGN